MNDYDPRDTGENAINSSPPNSPRAIAYGVNRLGSRHASNDTFHLDLHRHSNSTTSQPNLDPVSASPSLTRQNRSGATNNSKYKLDFYSIPVFLLELIALAALGYGAYYAHYEIDYKPRVAGFYCDDDELRHVAPHQSRGFVRNFEDQTSEFQFILLAMLSPLAVIVFCELVNSMFGALKFRKIRAACACCKIHSITRRTLRITGAYLLGFLVVLTATDLLTITTGRLRPYFGAVCPEAYSLCVQTPPGLDGLSPSNESLMAATNNNNKAPQLATDLESGARTVAPLSPTDDRLVGPVVGHKTNFNFPQRPWVSLDDITEFCSRSNQQLSDDLGAKHLAASWPSLPAAIISYICIYMSYYLCYVGTARPFRMLTCVIVGCLVMTATVFNVELVKIHYHHWEDVAASAALAFLVTHFIVIVYLNRFRDSHYYEGQKLITSRRCADSGYDEVGQQMDEIGGRHPLGDKHHHNGAAANDIALKYFHIPRANYRGSKIH